MHGLVTILPTPFYEKVETLWGELEQRFDIRGIYVTPYPHFSWQIGTHYPQDVLQQAVKGMALQTQSFQIRTTGIGIFTGETPVIFIQVVKDTILQKTHQSLWEHLEGVGENISPYYHPSRWMPHISLAYGDVTGENIGEILKWLAFQDFNWEMNVDNVSFIYEPDGMIGELIFTESFSG